MGIGRLLIVVGIIYVLGVVDIVADLPWEYPEVRQHWVPYGGHWTTIIWKWSCQTGEKQSPVNISRENATFTEYRNLDFFNYSTSQANVSVTNDGHTLVLNKFKTDMKVEGGPLNASYTVEEVHFHWKAEHFIDGVQHPLEMHIVHRIENATTLEKAQERTDGILIIAVHFHESWFASDTLEPILKMIDQIRPLDKINTPVTMSEPIVLRKFFPDFNGYFHYNGSMTKPPCSEVVKWIILEETYPIQLKQMERFQKLQFKSKDWYPYYYVLKSTCRDLKNLNGRNITYANVEKQNAAAMANLLACVGAIVLIIMASGSLIATEFS